MATASKPRPITTPVCVPGKPRPKGKRKGKGKGK